LTTRRYESERTAASSTTTNAAIVNEGVVRMTSDEAETFMNKVLSDQVLRTQFLSAVRTSSGHDGTLKQQLLSTLDGDWGFARLKRWWSVSFAQMKGVVVLQLLLSGLLTVVFVLILYLTFSRIDIQPAGIDMGGGRMEMFDPFIRAKDLLTLIIPIFTTVLSFWLGFSIQDTKVKQANETAETQRQMREESDEMMAKIKGRMMAPEPEGTGTLREHIEQIMQKQK
jgi:ABC-type dipeptide/oligopeptide/nickel transport system permease component